MTSPCGIERDRGAKDARRQPQRFGEMAARISKTRARDSRPGRHDNGVVVTEEELSRRTARLEQLTKHEAETPVLQARSRRVAPDSAGRIRSLIRAPRGVRAGRTSLAG